MPPLPPVTQPRFRFRRGALEPPGLWVTDSDVFQFRIDVTDDQITPIPGPTHAYEARIRVIGPRLVPEDYRLTITSDQLGLHTAVAQAPAAEGFVQGAIITRQGDFPDVPPFDTRPGQVYGQLTVGRFLASGGYEHTLLCAGYVTARSAVGFPGGHHQAVGDGLGALQASAPQTGAGAGAQVQYNAQFQATELVYATVILIVGGASVAKAPRLTILDDALNTTLSVAPAANVAPGAAQLFTWGAGCPVHVGVDTRVVLPLPTPCFVVPNGQVVIATSPAMQAGDTLSTAIFTVRRWAV